MFTEFWSQYPKKVGKNDAAKVFKKLSPSEELFGRIMDGVQQQLRSTWKGKIKQYILNPATWLNGEHWSDELIDNSPAPDHQIGTIGRDEPPEPADPSPQETGDAVRRELLRIDGQIAIMSRQPPSADRAEALENLRTIRGDLIRQAEAVQ